MKKKIFATLMLSTVVLSNVSYVAVISANDIDSQIEVKNQEISSLTAQQAAAQQQVDNIQAQVDEIVAEQAKLNEENARLESESASLGAEIERLSADIVSRDGALKEQARSAQVDASASSYRLLYTSSSPRDLSTSRMPSSACKKQQKMSSNHIQIYASKRMRLTLRPG